MNADLTSPMLDAILTPRALAHEQPEIASNGASAEGAGGGFASAIKDAVAQVDGQQQAADAQLAAVDAGDSDDLVGAMLSSQQASLSFSMMIQVRNKMMNAFDDIIKMPV
ncbi:flagellar hook-basal body complex protein FliE [Burkholderia sp. Ac-20379]|uniref:flagellar hook-basal body complex protein FliE n=1 Tax=Burkholderia sp. Ac-20379 TaxID=2703900 RepID=UPI00197EABB0|nr:flagellar hook-basal body complex protein FliE [Burkholderia sp. Ac-20379]MBN3728488.1 flagellar hook-basal body complex protein FliE [Burkholderia sp. Ac-20379]